MKITVVYDSEVLREGLKAGWGFSCLIDKDILFDTGGDGVALLDNMKKLGIDPSDIESVVLSHGHGDHTGGLFELLEENQDLSVYIPAQLSRALKSQIPTKTRLIEVREPMQIRKEVFTTGELGTFIKEQSLVYLNRRGALVITGCSHPGLGTILNAASKFGEIYGVIGGFHGFSDLDLLKDIKVISPCHCTQYKREIACAFPKQYVKCGAGLVIE